MQNMKLHNTLSDWLYKLLPAMSACLGKTLTTVHLEKALTKLYLEQKAVQSRADLLISGTSHTFG